MKNKSFYKKWWFWLIVAIIGFGITNDLSDDGQLNSSRKTTVSSISTETTVTETTTQNTKAYDAADSGDRAYFKTAIQTILENRLKITNFEIDQMAVIRENRVHVLSDGTELNHVIRGSFKFTYQDKFYAGKLITHVDEKQEQFNHIEFSSDYNNYKIKQDYTIKTNLK